MNDKDIKNLIKIPSNLDDSVLKGIERGREEKKLMEKTKNKSSYYKVASVIVVGGLILGTPIMAKAKISIENALKGFNSSNFGAPIDKYVEFSKSVGIAKEDKESTIRLDDVIIDDNMFMFGLTVESEFLSKSEYGKNEGDFFTLDADIILNGQRADSYGVQVRKIDSTTGAAIISGNIAELKLKDEVDVKLNISAIDIGGKSLNGKWNFKVSTNKENSKRIVVNESVDIDGKSINIDEVIVSKLRSTILISGKNIKEDDKIMRAGYRVVDDEGHILRASELGSSLDMKNGDYSLKIEVDDDLSNVSGIKLVPYFERSEINKEIDGIYYDLLTTTGNKEDKRENIVVSREARKEEKEDGYALKNVNYYLNIDKNKEFLTIEQLKGYEINVNNKEKVIIQDIVVSDNTTKVIVKIEGGYEYQNISQLVIFDENMNDSARWEGNRGVIIEDEKEGIYSIVLDKIDTSKKYKVAVPMTKNINIDEKYATKINLD